MSAETPRISTSLTAAGVDVHGLPFKCCDEWPECTHMYYVAQAVQAHTRRIQVGVGEILKRHEAINEAREYPGRQVTDLIAEIAANLGMGDG